MCRPTTRMKKYRPEMHRLGKAVDHGPRKVPSGSSLAFTVLLVAAAFIDVYLAWAGAGINPAWLAMGALMVLAAVRLVVIDRRIAVKTWLSRQQERQLTVVLPTDCPEPAGQQDQGLHAPQE